MQKRKEIKVEEIHVETVVKQNYTVEDLVNICKMLEDRIQEYKNLRLDVEAQEKKNEMMEKKIENAEIYLKEIDKHKKSIFEFWKFANKDNDLGLNPGQNTKEDELPHKLQKVFKYEEDIEELGIKMDEKQRKKLTKEELDAIFITRTELLNALNCLRKPLLTKKDEKIVEETFQTIKKAFRKAKENAEITDIDIFGGMSEDKRKIRILANKKHREVEKNVYSILGIHEDIKFEQFKEILQKILGVLERVYPKIISPYHLSVYKVDVPEKDVNDSDYSIFQLNPEKAIQKQREKELNLYRLNIEEKMPLIFFTNIMFYDNLNQTLPLGMSLAEEVLVDMSKFELQEIKKEEIRINDLQEDDTILNKKIYVYEYQIKNKEGEDHE